MLRKTTINRFLRFARLRRTPVEMTMMRCHPEPLNRFAMSAGKQQAVGCATCCTRGSDRIVANIRIRVGKEQHLPTLQIPVNQISMRTKQYQN